MVYSNNYNNCLLTYPFSSAICICIFILIKLVIRLHVKFLFNCIYDSGKRGYVKFPETEAVNKCVNLECSRLTPCEMFPGNVGTNLWQHLRHNYEAWLAKRPILGYQLGAYQVDYGPNIDGLIPALAFSGNCV